jgi:quercetin dioxygenase-like cupin family protein
MHSQLIVLMAARTARTGLRTTRSCRAGANISIILESTTKAGVGPRLHKHPYAETFIIRRGWATFTVESEQFRGHAGQVLVVPADTPHKFSTGPDGYEGVHIHANVRFVTEWLE